MLVNIEPGLYINPDHIVKIIAKGNGTLEISLVTDELVKVKRRNDDELVWLLRELSGD